MARCTCSYKMTVEPVLFLFMLAMYMLLPALQDLIYIKVCLEKYGLAVCENLYTEENKGALDYTQMNASHWVLASTLTMALPSIITAQFLGSWSDTYGRKIPMLLPPVGGLLSSVVYIVMAGHLYQTPVALVILASLIAGLCGGFSSCILTCMSYVAQTSNSESRTMRVGVLEGMTYLGGTLGPALGGWITQGGGRAATFAVILSCHAAIVLFIIIFVRNIPPRHSPSSSWIQSGCRFKHLRESLDTVMKARQEGRRLCLILLLSAVVIIMICTAGELDIGYLYVRDKPLEWRFEGYTLYFSFKYALGVLALLLLLPFASAYFPDTFLAGIGLVSKIAGLLLLAFAWNTGSVYGSAMLSLLSNWPMSVIRAAMSKLVETDEQGKLFASVALLENVSTLIASALFNTIYPATRNLPIHGLIFILAALVLIIPLILLSMVQKYFRRFESYDTVGDEAKELDNSDEERTIDGGDRDGEIGKIEGEEEEEENPPWVQGSNPNTEGNISEGNEGREDQYSS